MISVQLREMAPIGDDIPRSNGDNAQMEEPSAQGGGEMDPRLNTQPKADVMQEKSRCKKNYGKVRNGWSSCQRRTQTLIDCIHKNIQE